MNYGSIVVLTDNRKLVRRINNEIEKSNWLAQDAGAEIAAIKDIIEKATIRIVVQYTKGKPTINRSFEEYPDPHLIIICHNKANQAMK